MAFKKTFRYYYWLVAVFIKKHLRIIALSFLLSFILIIGLISFTPYIQSFFFNKKEIIGIVGDFDYNNLPEEVVGKISNGLLFINEKGELIPGLASSWETVDEGKEYRFHLRDGLIWSDGKNFSAYDINYQFKDVETKILDDKTVYFTLSKPLPIFPTFLKKPIIKPPLLGIAGLYKVEKIKLKQGSITELALNPNKKDLPFIVYKFYKSESDLINAYKTGLINQLAVNKKSIADGFQTWKNTSISKSVDYNKLLTLYFSFDNQLLKQKEIRQAITMSIDQTKFSEFGEFALSPITPISWAYSLTLKSPLFDPTAAQKTLNKASNSTESAKLNLYTYYDYLNSAEQIKKFLTDAGLNINVKLVSSDRPANFDLFLAFWNVPADPDQYFFWHSTQTQGNLGNYKNVKIDKLLEDARNTSVIAERKKLYLDFQKVITDDPPAVFFYFPYVYTIKRK